jgi:cytochrome c-type biogenesis protein CcmE
MTRRKRRLVMVGFCALGIAIAATLSATAFRDTLVFFYSPSDLAANGAPPADRMFRLGGMVEKGSVKHAGNTVTFTVTDFRKTLPVTYTGLLPDLFREGQGVVAEGRLQGDGVFHADTILAKHDERYMPPEVAKAIGQTGAEHHETDTLVGR